MEGYQFELRMKVRDYELDAQGVVNNSNYQRYLEHTRHEFTNHAGISFTRLLEEGIIAVVSRIELDFKYPLKGNDEFVCCVNVKKEGVKFIFQQDIYRCPDGKPILKGVVNAVCTKEGRIMKHSSLDDMFAPYL